MADNDDNKLDLLGQVDGSRLSSEERARLLAEEQRRLRQLADEVSRRYDPARLGRATIAGAGSIERLDDSTRRDMEKRLGVGFSQVRVVRGAFADRVLRHHRADAVTLGATGLILVRDTPRANMKTTAGRALLAHELTHVRQAQSGMKFAIEGGSDGAAYEREADKEAQHLIEDETGGHEASDGDHGHDPEDLKVAVLKRFHERRRHHQERRGFDDT